MKTYWVITLDQALYDAYGMNNIFKMQAEILYAGLKIDHTPAVTVAFQFNSKESFEEAFGDNCLVIDATDMARSKCLQHAESLGWIQDNTSSGFVTWWL